MAAKPTMLTAEGLKNLEEELAELQNVKRKEIAEKIKVARSYGDLSENSEYDDAKNEQAIMAPEWSIHAAAGSLSSKLLRLLMSPKHLTIRYTSLLLLQSKWLAQTDR